MLSWIFKKFGRKSASAAPSAHAAAQEQKAKAAELAQETQAQKSAQKAREVEDAKSQWAPRLQAALGDEAALLALAQATPLLDIKLAAIEALSSEESLKQAEREFRKHDRRVQRLAKQKLEAAVARRVARSQAQALIASAQALQADAELPVNRLISLDREWQALDAALLAPEQIETFSRLSAALNQSLRERSEQEQALQRWSQDAEQALSDWQARCMIAASEAQVEALDGLIPALQALQTAQPQLPQSQALAQRIDAALGQTESLLAKLSLLAHCRALPAVPAAPAQTAAAPTESEAAAEATEATPPEVNAARQAFEQAVQQWQALPALAQAAWEQALQLQFAAWKRTQAGQAKQDAAEAATPKAEKKKSKPEEKRRPSLPDASAEQLQQLEVLLQAAEAAASEGLSSEMLRQLQAVDTLTESFAAKSLSDALRGRLQPLHAERMRLRDWEHWGGARALDALVAEAEQLAQATPQPAEAVAVAEAPKAETEAAQTSSPSNPTDNVAEATPAAPAAPKLNLKAHREAIQSLRQRWKEVERLSGGAGQALWARFDAALQIAHRPIAAQVAEMRAARESNLAAREVLLSELQNAAVLSGEATAALAAEEASAHWKEQLRLLSQFQTAWRQLGPVEHTVPHAAQSDLLQRQRSLLERIEQPLQQARARAEAQREQLIAAAETLARDIAAQPQQRDATQRVRDLQAQWQAQARSLPLARAAENSLWARFKTATDAVFAQREAAFNARDEAISASVAGYEALLAQLTALTLETPDAEIRRTLAEVDRGWRQGGELPRATEAALNTRLQAAHQAALQILQGRSQLQWQAQCETLAKKWSLCLSREQNPAALDEASFATQWAQAGALPAAWEQALNQRQSGPADAAFDEVLLQLEAALDLDSSPELMAARRQLKLKALKDAMEGRGSSEQGPAQQAAWFVAALRQGQLSAEQHARLQALINALREAPAGALGTALAKV
ncbi:DUF349 domain-containing protein [Paucibacter sp. Y2R2-4]|uniref:DUF349 domain-containing protein n=1 Tax=Paucibacter sp. Y2R2-4 TaxID=2893553 RepID=UPI0021E3DFA8|nr:DUF349 domain-containing protein [Paucibacter sp. Y2R2-4]MCV2352416.1 DUF349 domain-containing protein [Paucibacter sp. Y2R2-4]